MNNYPSDEILSAYVDGELSPEDHARIADAIARDSRLAAQVAALSQVKSALSGLAITPELAVRLPRGTWSKGLVAVAASLGLLIAVLSGVLTGLLDFNGARAGWYELAAAKHAGWVRQPVAPNLQEIDANTYLASVDRLHLPVFAPDLTSAKLRLTYIRLEEPAGETPAALHLGYTGRHGCRVTLWITAAGKTMSTKLAENRNGNQRGFRWRAGKTAYALFATGMAENRFTTIARMVYEATNEGHGFDEDMRLALNEATRTAPPCAA